MINFRTTLMLTTGLAASLASAPALGAQAQPQAQPVTDVQAGSAAPAPASAEEEIVITAQKRAQTTIEVPQSVSVVSDAPRGLGPSAQVARRRMRRRGGYVATPNACSCLHGNGTFEPNTLAGGVPRGI